MRQRVLVSSVVGVALVIAALDATFGVPTTRLRVALALLGALGVAALGGLSVARTRRDHPLVTRVLVTVVVVVIALVATARLSSNVDTDVAIGAAMTIVLLGLSFLTGSSGQISLGNGAFMGVGAFTVAIWANHHATSPLILVLVLAVAAGAAVGFLLGLPATRLRGPYLAGMTLAFAVAFGAVLNVFGSWTGGDSGLQLPNAENAPRWLVHLYPASTASLSVNSVWLAALSVVSAGVALLLMANLFASRFGRAMRLVRDNDVAAELVGISLPRARVVAFVVSAAYAALGGALWTVVNNAVTPSTYGLALSITILSLVVIGGIGTIPGAIIGGLIYAFANSLIGWITTHTGLNPQGNVASQLNGIIFGVLLVATIVFAPMGISGALRRLWAHRSR